MLVNLMAIVGAFVQPEPLDPDLACIVDRIAPVTRRALIEEVRSGGRGEVHNAFDQAASACARQRGWQEELRTALLRLAGSLVLAEESAAMLEREGISAERIDRWYQSQTPDFRARGEISPADGGRLVQQLIAEGIAVDALTRNGETIGLYVGALALIESTAAGRRD